MESREGRGVHVFEFPFIFQRENFHVLLNPILDGHIQKFEHSFKLPCCPRRIPWPSPESSCVLLWDAGERLSFFICAAVFPYVHFHVDSKKRRRRRYPQDEKDNNKKSTSGNIISSKVIRLLQARCNWVCHRKKWFIVGRRRPFFVCAVLCCCSRVYYPVSLHFIVSFREFYPYDEKKTTPQLNDR